MKDYELEIVDLHIRPAFVWALAEGDPEARRYARHFVPVGVPDPAEYLLQSIDAARPWFAELRAAISRNATDAEKTDAARKLAARIKLRMEHDGREGEARALLAALRRLAREDGVSEATKKAQLLERAVFDVLSQRDRPQAHRFGRQWGPNSSGQYTHKREEVAPMSYVLTEFWAWFQDEVRKEVKAALLERSYPATGQDAYNGDGYGNDLLCSLDDGPREDAALVATEPGYENDLLNRLAQTGTPRERELLAALVETADTDELAARLGVKPSTVRVMLHKLRKAV